MAALLIMIMEVLKDPSGAVVIPLSDGSVLSGVLSKLWRAKGPLRWLGRTLDLEAAYKGLCNSPDTKWASIVCVYNPSTRQPELYVSDALMFGSTAAVYGFNRVARGIWHIAVVKFNLLVTQFFDDFPGVEPEATSAGARIAFQALLSALGWRWAVGKKDLPYQPAFPMLGTVFDLANLEKGSFDIANKPSRVDSLQQELSASLVRNRLSPASASELGGKLTFVECQIDGRAAVPAMRLIHDRANSRSRESALNDMLRLALNFLRDHLQNSPPRTVTVPSGEPPIVIFTDGSSEGNSHLWGCVVFIPGRKPLVAAGEIPPLLAEALLLVNEKIITQVEMFPLVLLKLHFSVQLAGKRVVWFIDNDGARDSFISGASASLPSMKLLCLFYKAQRMAPSYNWFARVASFSNPADAPSRGNMSETILQFGAEQFEPKGLSPQELNNLCSYSVSLI